MALSAPPELQWHLRGLGGPEPYLDLPRVATARRCIDSGRPWLSNMATDELLQKITLIPDRAKIIRAGVHSVLMVPLPTASRCVGIVILMRAGTSTPFTEDDVLTAQGVAARAASSIDSARRYSDEHTLALELQRALLSEPDSPHPSVEVATRYLPSGRSALVGGDWYDSIALPDCRTLLVMGDVMGHGFQAAVAMSQYRSVLRTVAAAGLPVDAMLREADRRARVATCLLALVDPQAQTCTAASAGHLPPVVISPGGGTEVMTLPAGPPVGTELGDYEMTTFAFEPGTVLLLYTDGLVEQRNTNIDEAVRTLTKERPARRADRRGRAPAPTPDATPGAPFAPAIRHPPSAIRHGLQLNGWINRSHHMTTCDPALAFPDRGLTEITHMQTAAVITADRPDQTVVAHNEFLHSFRHDAQNLSPIRRRNLHGLDANHADRLQVRIAQIIDVTKLLPSSLFSCLLLHRPADHLEGRSRHRKGSRGPQFAEFIFRHRSEFTIELRHPCQHLFRGTLPVPPDRSQHPVLPVRKVRHPCRLTLNSASKLPGST
jgi:serine/threonine protein phosphatase PrpC